MSLQIPLDATDEAILRALRGNGRRAYRDIAREIGVSEGTVRARVRKLEHIGALRFLAFVDPQRLANSMLALMLVRVEGPAQPAVVETLSSWDETTYVSSLAGRADIYAQIICTGSDGLNDVIARTRGLPGVIDTETMIELDVHKFTYSHQGASTR
jgi:Lrp/AsnC family transcriptional regulator for asnA, asnC and gidA